MKNLRKIKIMFQKIFCNSIFSRLLRKLWRSLALILPELSESIWVNAMSSGLTSLLRSMTLRRNSEYLIFKCGSRLLSFFRSFSCVLNLPVFSISRTSSRMFTSPVFSVSSASKCLLQLWISSLSMLFTRMSKNCFLSLSGAL